MVDVYAITKRFGFSASHQLSGLPEGHQCARLHGHNYTVEVELRADHLDGAGMVLDYGELGPFREYLDANLDHQHLNDVLPGINPTAEALAVHLYNVATLTLREALQAKRREVWQEGMGRTAYVAAVRVMETPNTVAEYRP